MIGLIIENLEKLFGFGGPGLVVFFFFGGGEGAELVVYGGWSLCWSGYSGDVQKKRSDD